MSLRDKILQAEDADIVSVSIPEWGGKDDDFYVKTFTNAEAANFSKLLDGDDDKLLVGGVIMGLCDSKGAPILTKEDAETLSSKNSKIVARVFNAIVEHNKVVASEEDIKN